MSKEGGRQSNAHTASHGCNRAGSLLACGAAEVPAGCEADCVVVLRCSHLVPGSFAGLTTTRG